MDIKLNLPFKGNFPVSFSFGATPVDENIKQKYQQWGLSGHNGIDYALPEGSEVLASDTGKVIQSGDNGDFGISVTLEHSWGVSIYGHLKESKVAVDQEIKAGELIGLSGNTGFSLGPHLHFGIKLKDADLNNGYLGFSDPSQYINEPDNSVSPINHSTDTLINQSTNILSLKPQADKARAKKREENLNKVLELVKIKGEINNLDVRELLRVSQSTASYYLTELTKKGLLKIKDKGRSTTYSI